MTHFEREKLPSPRSFFGQEFGRLGRSGRVWSLVTCCFHEDKTPSLSLNRDTGGFYCFGCQAKGGDLVDFVQLRYHLSFKDACRQLGVWRENANPSKLPPGRFAPFLVLDFKIDGVQYRASVRDEPRNYEDKIQRFYREASDRLIELSHGDSETYSGEQENCWDRMACAQDELRELEIL